ncbi:alpha/beta hydrolase [Luteimonas sp. Y-2-2-4F]|nr:alpha/beta fold hydrolase [Luteimonas sp. Y-2-2-4F]MCD9030316.1 alpha/beta hydrolase [Luteimonas sp. Y-2-2-4F]
MKAALWLLAVAAALYLALCLLMFSQQRRLIYYPQFTRADPAGTDFALDRGDAVLRGWIANPGASDPVLYFGGNAERVEDNREAFAAWLPARIVYLPAHRGYGASDGEPGQAALFADALALYDFVRARHPGQRISVIGRSLGSGVAAHLAAQRPVDRLVLITPFDSLGAVAAGHYPWLPVRLLLRDRYDSAAQLRGYRGPLLVLRAGRDEVVPPARTDALLAGLGRDAEVVAIDRADHNDVHTASEYGQALARFLR